VGYMSPHGGVHHVAPRQQPEKETIPMKKISALFASVCVLATFVASNASADNKPVNPAVNPAVVATATIFVNYTWVKGTIKVPTAAAVGNLAGLTCADIHVSAVSQEQNPPPPGGLFQSPKWSHTVAATGSWASGTCSYALTVVPGHNFAVSAGGTGPGTAANALKCYILPISTTPAQAGWFKLALGATKEQDFTVTNVNCVSSPPG
jgi:hypothetical protein